MLSFVVTYFSGASTLRSARPRGRSTWPPAEKWQRNSALMKTMRSRKSRNMLTCKAPQNTQTNRTCRQTAKHKANCLASAPNPTSINCLHVCPLAGKLTCAEKETVMGTRINSAIEIVTLLWPFAPLVPLLHPSPTFLRLNPLDPHRYDFEYIMVFQGETMGDLWTLEKGLAKTVFSFLEPFLSLKKSGGTPAQNMGETITSVILLI